MERVIYDIRIGNVCNKYNYQSNLIKLVSKTNIINIFIKCYYLFIYFSIKNYFKIRQKFFPIQCKKEISC